MIFYQGGTIDHGTHVPGTVDKSSIESEYNAAYNAVMYLAHFSMLIHEFLNKEKYIVSEASPLIILDSKYSVCMSNIVKDTNHNRHISRRVIFLRNGENCKIYKIEWCEVRL